MGGGVVLRAFLIFASNGLSESKNDILQNLQKNKERLYFQAEKELRNCATKLIQEVSPNDFVFVCDVDEVLDGQDAETRALFLNMVAKHNLYPNIVRIQVRQRLWDFDNHNPNINLSCVLVKAGLLQSGKLKVGQVRISRTFGWRPPLSKEGIHEFSSCLSREGLSRKYQTYVHHSDSDQNLNIALSCNMTLSYGGTAQYLSKLDLESDHIPEFIKNNFSILKTNNVHKDFEENRRKNFRFRLEYQD